MTTGTMLPYESETANSLLRLITMLLSNYTVARPDERQDAAIAASQPQTGCKVNVSHTYGMMSKRLCISNECRRTVNTYTLGSLS